MRPYDVTVRKFRESDAEAVSELIRRNLTEVNCKDYPESVVKSMYEAFTPKYIRTLSNKRKMYVALYDDKVIGTASLDYDTVYTVFVDVDYHRKGVGRKLMELLEEIAANNGLSTLQLPASITARKFYEKLGYQFVKQVESEENGIGLIMEKYLAQ